MSKFLVQATLQVCLRIGFVASRIRSYRFIFPLLAVSFHQNLSFKTFAFQAQIRLKTTIKEKYTSTVPPWGLGHHKIVGLINSEITNLLRNHYHVDSSCSSLLLAQAKQQRLILQFHFIPFSECADTKHF